MNIHAETQLDPATRLTTRVNVPEEEHTISIRQVLPWLDGAQQVHTTR